MIPHAWDISPAEAVKLQGLLAKSIRIEPIGRPVRTIVGADCAFIDGGRRIVAVAVLCDARSMEVVESASITRPCTFAYIPGLLSFREAPAIIDAVRKLTRQGDLLMCDGQGIAHPRRLGLACHVGLWLDMPTIGVAKSRLCGLGRQPGPKRGCCTQLRHGGAVVGAVVRTRTAVKPLYISVGHRITLAESVRWTLRCGRGTRLPDPTRRAHQFVTSLKPCI